MRRKPALAFCATLLLTCATFSQVRVDQTIPMSDGVSLDAATMIPSGAPPAGGFPGIVVVHGFGGSKDEMLPVLNILAARGYASLAYSVRGQGQSGGLSSAMGSRERQDLLEVIRHFRSVAGVDSEKLGVTGASQGGIHAWMAAVDRMPGVRTVAPLIATPDFARALAPNGCVRYGLTYEMSLGSVRYDAERDRVKNFIIADQYDSVLAYISTRDLAHAVDSIQIPVFQELGWADYLFPANGGIDAAANLTARSIPVRSYYGTNGHGESMNTQETLFQLDQTLQWFDHWLKGLPLPQDSVAFVTYADDRPNWPHHITTSWPPDSHQMVRLYFTKDGLSTVSPASDGAFPFTLAYNQAFTPEMAWSTLYAGSQFTNAFSSSAASLVSAPLQDSVEITGTPGGLVHTTSDASKFQTHVQLYDVFGARWEIMSRASNGIRNNQPNQAHDIHYEGSALSHIVPAGHSLGVVITSFDTLRYNQANTIPYFLSSHSVVLSSAQAPSYLDLPVVGSSPLAALEAPKQRPGPDFRLEQNYPNPFNPKTGVRFQVPGVGEAGGDQPASGLAGGRGSGARVKLAVYDLLGREVAVLVNERKAPGNYEVSFDASGLASGIYIYRLTAGLLAQSRKMILVK